jgi:hypothetical protein
LNTIEKSGGVIYQVECDSIIFSFPKLKPLPVSLSHCLGDFKSEIDGEIISYYSFGPKNYTITYQDKNDSIQTITKVSGLSLKNAILQNELTPALFKKFLENFESLQTKCLTQIRTKRKHFEIKSNFEQCTYSNSLSKRRFLKKNSIELILYPFGYSTLYSD